MLTLNSWHLFCAKDMLKSEFEMTTYGYARVSTDGQTFAAQEAALHAAGCAKVYAEKVSGAVTDRKALARALAALKEGDTLIVTRLDRLARSTRDLLNTLDTIAKTGAGFKSLADAWADTTTPHGRLMLTVLGGLAEFERELIRARTGEGRARAKARGVHMGRPPKLTPHQQAEARQRRDNGETLTDIARTYGVAHTTIARL
jgi:DNA invertase Pin-like site-specific DNA recombinase